MKLENEDCRLAVSYDRDWCEWVVKVWDADGRRPTADYFTDTREDAMKTAKHMLATSRKWTNMRCL